MRLSKSVLSLLNFLPFISNKSPGIQIFLIRYPWGYACFTSNKFQTGVPNFTNLIPDRRQYFDLNIALKFHEFGHTISQKLCFKVPVSGVFCPGIHIVFVI